jgi:hypothetical protein
MGAILSSESAVPTRSAQRHIPEDNILHGHRRENLKSYTGREGFAHRPSIYGKKLVRQAKSEDHFWKICVIQFGEDISTLFRKAMSCCFTLEDTN